MIKLIITIVFISCLVEFLHIQAGLVEHPCKDAETKKLYAVGAQWPNSRICAINICTKDYGISVTACPLIVVKENCKISAENNIKPYPECCADATCPDEN